MKEPGGPLDVSFSVLGTCISRDIVELLGYHVRRFVQDISPISTSLESPLDGEFKLTEENIVDYLLDPQLNHFHKRNILLDINKDLYQYFFSVKSDWLILDAGCLRFSTFFSKKRTAGVTEFIFDRFSGLLDKSEFDSVAVNDMDDDCFAKSMDDYILPILKNFDERKIIVVEQYLVGEYVDAARSEIHKFNDEIKESNKAIFRGYNYFKNKIGNAHFIPFPSNILGDEIHKWGRNPLHYVSEYYEYGSEAIKIILKELPMDDEKSMIARLREGYEHKIEVEYLYF